MRTIETADAMTAQLLASADPAEGRCAGPHAGPAHPGIGLEPLLLVSLILVAVLAYLPLRFWSLPVEGDAANWDYVSQVIARGGVPYRDAADQRTPLSGYIGAAAILLLQPLGLRDIYAIRLAYMAQGVATVALTYLLARQYFGSRRVALLAGLILVGFNAFSVWNASGVESKTPMVLFGLLALWAIRADRPLLSGLFGMLSALAWQGGLLFVGTAGLAFSRYLTRWRDGAALRVIAGALAPLAITLAYFASQGALEAFFVWTVHFNFAIYGPRESEAGATLLGRLEYVLERFFDGDRLYFALAPAGWLLATCLALRRGLAGGPRGLVADAASHAVLIAPFAYFLFSLISVQGGRDLVPFLPFLGIYSALLLAAGVDLLAGLAGRGGSAVAGAVRSRLSLIVGAAVFMGSVADGLAARPASPTLEEQQADVADIVAALAPGDRVLVHDAAEVLVLGQLENVTPFFFLQRYLGGYLDATHPGGFQGWLHAVKAQRPKVIAFGWRRITRREAFEAWLRSEYVPRKGQTLKYYLRSDLAP